MPWQLRPCERIPKDLAPDYSFLELQPVKLASCLVAPFLIDPPCGNFKRLAKLDQGKLWQTKNVRTKIWEGLCDFLGPRDAVIFFCPQRFVIFLSRGIAWFFVPRVCVIFCPKRLRDFFCPEKLRDFFCPETLRDCFVLKGCVTFLSQEVAWFFLSREVAWIFFVPKSCMNFCCP